MINLHGAGEGGSFTVRDIFFIPATSEFGLIGDRIGGHFRKTVTYFISVRARTLPHALARLSAD